VPGTHAKSYAQAVPGDNCRHGKRQISHLLFAKVLARVLVNSIRHVSGGDVGDRFRPGQCGPFALGVVGRFAPGVERVHALLVFALRLKIFPMHVEAKGAAIHLRDPKLNHVK